MQEPKKSRFYWPPPLFMLRQVFRATDWRVLAALAALLCLINASGLLLYPHIFQLSPKGYSVMAKTAPEWVWGWAGLMPSLWFLARVHRPSALWALLGVVGFNGTITIFYFLGAGLSVGTLFYMVATWLGSYGYIKSGGPAIFRRLFGGSP